VTELWLSRARLRRDAPSAALARLLVPDAADARAAAAHHLVWSLFADGPDRRRDFLWRQEGPGRFLALSARPPTNLSELFEIESKPFAPVISAGDRLGFALRANPVVARATAPGTRGKRHDVVMDALRDIPKGAQRAEARPDKLVEAGRAWLARQGAAHGFCPVEGVAVDGYARVRIPRAGGSPAVFGVLDFEGALTVEDPPSFLAALAAGFGRARSFGCGLMLIRRRR
jgi:CRISPR system Cascade subunit CasE